MSKTIKTISVIILVVHGLIHLMGPAVYMKLIEIQDFSYKTTLLGGRWDLGENGISIFGAMWVVPAVGFIVISIALLAKWKWWKPILVAVALFSLVLTVLDWSIAYAGAALNIFILVVVGLKLRITSWFSR